METVLGAHILRLVGVVLVAGLAEVDRLEGLGAPTLIARVNGQWRLPSELSNRRHGIGNPLENTANVTPGVEIKVKASSYIAQ